MDDSLFDDDDERSAYNLEAEKIAFNKYITQLFK